MKKKIFPGLIVILLAAIVLGQTNSASLRLTSPDVMALRPSCPDINDEMKECEAKGGSMTRYVDSLGCTRINCTTKAIPAQTLTHQTTTTQPACPDVNAAIRECEAKGLAYTTYVTGNCRMVLCADADTPPADEKECPDIQKQIEQCRLKGGTISRRYDERKCIVIDCAIPEANCPPAEEIEKTIISCKEQGLSYITYAKDGCRHAECVKPNPCPSQGELEYSIRKCITQAMNYEAFADANGCRQIRCVMETPCPTHAELEQKIRRCRENAMEYKLVSQGQTNTLAAAYVACYDVECVITGDCPPVHADIESCRKRGLAFEYYVDSNRCERARCITQTDECPPLCPTDEQIKAIMLRCEENGMGYEFYNDAHTSLTLAAQTAQVCRRIRCVQRACPQDAEIERMIKACEQRGMSFQSYEDKNGCKSVMCVPDEDECPPYEVTQEIIRSCREKKLEVESYIDENGCKNVRCADPEQTTAVECRKMLKGDCVIISCSDGYTFDSCNPQGICPQIECKRIVDEQGCIVRHCSDGSESRTCPDETPVECEVIRRDDGCTVKRCTDGRQQVSCPPTECREYEDERGCRIRDCVDGSTERICPEESLDFECRVYADEDGCEIHECTNGYRASSCDPEPLCSQRRDGSCTIKTCIDGSTQRICPEGEIRCITHDTPDGCTMTVCTDGTDDKICPTSVLSGDDTAPADPTPDQEKTEPIREGGWLSNLLKSIGL
jgi:hypothetical protein